MSKTVYPVEGRYLNGVPHLQHDCDDKECLASGAFTDKPPAKTKAAASEGPPDGGPSDSKE